MFSIRLNNTQYIKANNTDGEVLYAILFKNFKDSRDFEGSFNITSKYEKKTIVETPHIYLSTLKLIF